MKGINSLADGHGPRLTTDGGCDCPILLYQQVFRVKVLFVKSINSSLVDGSWSASDYSWRL